MIMNKNNTSKFSNWHRKNYGCYLFLIPAFIGFFVFSVYPLVYSLLLSFTDYNGSRFTEIGVFNYVHIFSSRLVNGWETIRNSFLVTFKFTLIAVPIGMVLSFSLALLLHQKLAGMKVFRILFYLPCLIPGIAMAVIYADMFQYPDGIINQLLEEVGFSQLKFFTTKETVMPTYIFAGFFGLGGNMIMWLAALGNVPPQLTESAKIDGAGALRILFKITIPMCTPIIFYTLINSLIATLQIFDSYASIGVGPEESMYFIVILVYNIGFNQYQMGFACAIAWLLFVIIALITLSMFRFQGWVHYMDEEN